MHIHIALRIRAVLYYCTILIWNCISHLLSPFLSHLPSPCISLLPRNYYSQIAMDSVITGEGCEECGFPGSIYLDSIDHHGLIRTGPLGVPVSDVTVPHIFHPILILILVRMSISLYVYMYICVYI